MLNQASSLLGQTSFMPAQVTSGIADVLPAAPIQGYFTSAANPADGGTLTGTQVSLTPPAGMQAGDLVIATCISRTVSLTFTVFTTGGQTWNIASAGFGISAKSMAVFWCRFNGTWAANPVYECLTNALQISAVMHVFRPDSPARVWAVDVALANTNNGTPTGPPFVATRVGLTTANPRSVQLAGWYVAAANTWANLAGAGWVVPGLAQYRNATQLSMAFAYALNLTSGAVVPNVANEESAASVVHTSIMSWWAA